MKAEQIVKTTSEQILAQHAKALEVAEQGIDKILAGVKTANIQILGAYKQTPEPFTPSENTVAQLQSAMDTYTKLIETTSSYVLNTTAEVTRGWMEKTSEASLKAAAMVKV